MLAALLLVATALLAVVVQSCEHGSIRLVSLNHLTNSKAFDCNYREQVVPLHTVQSRSV